MAVTLRELDEHAVEVRLTDGDNGNRFTTEDIQELQGFLDVIRARNPLVAVIRQDGRDFSLGRVARPEENGDPAIYRLLSEVTQAWAELPCLTVAAARGRVEGFGVGFVFQADISVVSEETRFRFPEIRNGFAPSVVMAWLTTRVAWQTQARWILTGADFPAHVAWQHGLVGTLVPASDVAAEVKSIVDELGSLDATALRECKRFARSVTGLPTEAASLYAVDSLTRQFVERTRET